MLKGKYVLLRGLEVSDVDEIIKFWNHPELQQFRSQPRFASREEEVGWIQSTWERRRKGEAYIFGICLIEKNLLIGNIELRVLSNINRRGSLGITIFNPNYWGKGYGTEANILLLDYAFSTLNLHTIELEVFSFNSRALACYKKVGLVEIGTKREAHFAKGQYHDIIMMDIFEQEFKNRIEGD